MVSVVVAELPAGVTLAGAKLQLTPRGSGLWQEKLTGLPKLPPDGTTEIVNAAEPPALTDADVGELAGAAKSSPVPVRPTLSGDAFAPSWLIASVPLATPVAVGVKLTEKVHLAAGAMVAGKVPQLFVWENDEPVTDTTVTVNDAWPVFVRSTV